MLFFAVFPGIYVVSHYTTLGAGRRRSRGCRRARCSFIKLFVSFWPSICGHLAVGGGGNLGPVRALKNLFGAARGRFLLRIGLLHGILDFRNMVGEEGGIITFGGGGLGRRRLACSIIRVFASAVRR